MDFLGKTAAVIMDEFAFDRKLNLNLFSLTPPLGYTVIDELEVREPSEQDVVGWLRTLADLNEGEFPAALDMLTLIKL